jgi:hypothetical protein
VIELLLLFDFERLVLHVIVFSVAIGGNKMLSLSSMDLNFVKISGLVRFS